MKPEPENRIDPKAITAWRINGGFSSLTYWLIPLIYGGTAWDGDWAFWPVYLLSFVVILNTLLQCTVIPVIHWRRWRYQFDENEIDLKRGLFVVRRTLIPVKRVQHVDTSQGPVYRKLNLAKVIIFTAGSTHEIPALSEETAEEARNLISKFAREAQENV
ncbi:MAG: PH domain-containing protein [Balneolales bacterium]